MVKKSTYYKPSRLHVQILTRAADFYFDGGGYFTVYMYMYAAPQRNSNVCVRPNTSCSCMLNDFSYIFVFLRLFFRLSPYIPCTFVSRYD